MPLAAEDDGDSFEKYVKVYNDASLPDVVKVVLEFFQTVRHTSTQKRAVDLGEAGQARLNQVAHLVKGHFFFQCLNKLRSFRAGADETHIAQEHIPKLGQFVNAQFSQDASHFCDAVVFLCGPLRAFLLGIFYHRSEFYQLKKPAVFTRTRLRVKYRPVAVQLDS